MKARLSCAWLLVIAVGLTPAAAQELPVANVPDELTEARVSSPSRLAAGLRAYPDEVVDALLVLAGRPELVARLAEEPALLEHPDRIQPAPPEDISDAIRTLARDARVVAMAADHPQELERLRMLHSVAPDGLKLRIRQLRDAYRAAELAAGAAWQRALEEDPVALGEYRQLLTRFCQEQRETYSDFPYVHAARREYYYACVPDVAVVGFLAAQEGHAALKRVVGRWWADHAPEQIDARAARRGATTTVDTTDGTPRIALSPDARRAMWRSGERAGADSLGLVPVVLQPLADQPAEARQEYALAEHARLWSQPFPPAWPLAAPAVAAAQRPPQEVLAALPEMKQLATRGERDGRDAAAGEIRRARRTGNGYYYGYGGAWLGGGGYGLFGNYGALGWPLAATELDQLRSIGGILPGRYGSGYAVYGPYDGWTYVEPGGVRVDIGPTTYYYNGRSTRVRGTVSSVGVRRHYRSGAEQLRRQRRRYPTYGGRISGAPRYSLNRASRRATIGTRRSTTIGARRPSVIGQRRSRGGIRGPSGWQRRSYAPGRSAGVRSGSLRRTYPLGVRTRSTRLRGPSNSGVSRRATGAGRRYGIGRHGSRSGRMPGSRSQRVGPRRGSRTGQR